MKKWILLLCLCIGLTGCAAEVAPPRETPGQTADAPPQKPETEPEETPEPEPEPTTEELAENLLAEMTLEEKVGQLFIARYPDKGALTSIDAYHLGGYILFAKNFESETPETIRITTDAIQEQSKIPMLIAVDEEGGAVNRVSLYSQYRDEPFAAGRDLFAAGGWDRVAEDTAEKAALLQSLGLNVNFAPVCDVSTNPGDYIYPRAFGGDAAQTAAYVKTVVTAMKEAQIGSVLKHFPGYGDNTDTHTGIAVDDRIYDTFVNSDFLPFQAGIDAGADAILVSHNIVSSIDPELPASLSPAVHDILRTELGFTGVIVTDELSMQAIQDYTQGEEAAILAVEAGNDLLCCTDYALQYAAVLSAVESGRISEERINQSVMRILCWKYDLGLLS